MITDIISIKPIKLLSPKRFDILAKILYAKGRENNYDTNFHLDVYREHLFAWNNLCSPFDNKNGIEDYTNSFNDTLDSIKNGGFNKETSLVPITEDNVPLDGAHRVASCIIYNKDIFCRKGVLGDDGTVCDSYRLRNLNLNEKWLDAMALEYSILDENSFIVSLFPSVSNKSDQEVKSILQQAGEVIYEKDIFLNTDGALNYTIEMYYNESWIGEYSNGFPGANNKARVCFTNTNRPLKVFLIKFSEDEEALRKLKDEIRSLFEISNHSVHINDTHEETIRLSKLLFNNNSIHFLNNSKLKHYKNFEEQLNYFKEYIKQNNLNIDNYCITASSILSRYGLRQGNDLDYLHRGSEIQGHPMIHSHNNYAEGRYSTSIDDIIYNPDNHFYYNGVKFASLNIVKQLKTKRGESKDITDLKLIEDVI